MIRHSLLVMSLLVMSVIAQAQSGGMSKVDSLTFDGAIGLPSASIQNPDNSYAYYSGVSLEGRGFIPLLSTGTLTASLAGGIRYLDLRNNANAQSQKEFSNQIGPGIGLRIQYAKLYAGIEYYYMLARHYSVGHISKEISYEYTPLSYHFGIAIPMGALAFGASYGFSQGTIPTSKTHLSSVSKYEDSIIAVHLTWHTGSSLGKALSDLFK